MNSTRIRIEWLAARYLEAFEADDFDTQSQLWKLAETDRDLQTAFQQVHEDLLLEQEKRESETDQLALSLKEHLPSAELIGPPPTVISVGDVAEELFRHPANQLPAPAHTLNESLRQSLEPIPIELGLTKLILWAEAKFGVAPREYWKAFREAAMKLELRRAATTEYQLAARSAPKPEDRR